MHLSVKVSALLYQKHPPLWFLLFTLPFSYVYKLLVFLRIYLYQKIPGRIKTLPGHCISIGNLAVGGTGKTPVTIALADFFVKRHQKPVILTRGYRSGLKKNEFCCFLAGKMIFANFAERKVYADEAILQSLRLPTTPVVVGRKHFAAAQWYLTQAQDPSTLWLLDDGFSHLSVQRQLNIVLLDQQTSLADARLLPSGPLREPVSALARADMIIWTRADKKVVTQELPVSIPQFNAYFSMTPPYLSGHPATSLDKNLKACLVTAVARPERVFQDLLASGYNLVDPIFQADHSILAIDQMLAKAKEYDVIITTAKDFARDQSLASQLPKPLYIVDLGLSFDPDFWAQLKF